MSEMKMKHLELIQAIITRMANNSFLLKGWAVTLLAGIFALAWNQEGFLHYLLAYIPVIMFWFLDAYYLQQERLYRGLYDKVSELDDVDITFSMKPPAITEKNTYPYFKVLFSKTEIGFYIPLLVLITIVVIVFEVDILQQCVIS